MSSETISHDRSTRIDYLSRLPNELLEDIFNHAYSGSPPPLMPISKRLLPFHQQHLYRQVSLSSPSSVACFASSISSDEGKGKMVKAAKFDRTKQAVIESIEVLEKLFPLLPNVQHLDLQSHVFPADNRSTEIFKVLPSVKSVSIKAVRNSDRLVDPDYFSFLSALPSLDSLKVLNWPILDGEYDVEGNRKLAGVKTLAVEGQGAEDESVVGLVKMCPALLHLELVTTYDDQVDFSCCLPDFSPTLESLTLAANHPSSYGVPYDHLFLRFTHLRSLSLGDGLYSSTIHETLQQLPLLEKIRLEGGSISPAGFLTLVTGPTRLLHLETIVLNFYVGERGVHVDIESEIPQGPNMEDWKKPRASAKGPEEDVRSEASLQVDQLRQLIKVAGEEGIKIRGTVHEALRNLEDYWMEQNNRAILTIHYERHDGVRWHMIVELFAESAGVNLPARDAIPWWRERLELVKIDQPERDWFILTLKNKEEAKE
ncbi:hypothetical protein JCM5350_006115 [Sporobolomyces pararoseus]